MSPPPPRALAGAAAPVGGARGPRDLRHRRRTCHAELGTRAPPLLAQRELSRRRLLLRLRLRWFNGSQAAQAGGNEYRGTGPVRRQHSKV